MDKWIGIVSGTNRGLIFLDLDIDTNNKATGTFQLHDADATNVTGKVTGTLKDKSIAAELFDFLPQQEGIPKKGTINLTLSEDKKELRGTWQTDVTTNGECVLYK